MIMKKIRMLCGLLFAMTVLLSGCDGGAVSSSSESVQGMQSSGSDSASDDTRPEVSATTSTAGSVVSSMAEEQVSLSINPEEEPPQPILHGAPMDDYITPPDFLNEEQQNLYIRASRLASALFIESSSIDSFPLVREEAEQNRPVTYEDAKTENGAYYTYANGRYKRWVDFIAVMNSIFTPQCFDKMTVYEDGIRRFDELDGRLIILTASRGSNSTRTKQEDGYRLISSTENMVLFALVGYYDIENDGNITEREYNIQMNLTDEGWRISEYHITR